PVVYPNQEGLSRGKSKKRFALIGASALLLIASSVGIIGYFGSGSSDAVANKTIQTASNNLDNSAENQFLLNEIANLKSAIISLESKIANSQNSNNSIDNPVNGSTISDEAEGPNANNGVLISGIQEPNIHQGGQGASVLTAPNLIVATNSFVPSLPAISLSEPRLIPIEPILSVNVPLLSLNELNAIPEARRLLAKNTEKQLETYELTYVESPSDLAVNTVRNISKSEWKSLGVSEYSNSLRNRMSKFARKIQRMMDNPIALNNSRDPHYHVPGMTSQDLNIGSVGTLIAPRVQTMSRLQWYGNTNEQFSNQLSVDGYSYAIRGGVGIQLNHSVYNKGGIQVGNAMFTYSPKISVSKRVSVEPSVRFKMGNKYLSSQNMGGVSQVEFDRGNVHDYYSDSTAPVGKNLWYKDLGVGLNINTKWFFVSAQVDNIFNHRDNIYSTDLTDPRRAGTQFVATMGTDLKSRDEKMEFSPYMVYQKNEQLSESWLGFNYRWQWLTIGGAISSNLDPAASIGVKFKHFSMHVNSDYTYSLMNNKKALSHQVTLRFLGKPNRFGKRLLNL
ncbi:MAG: hypothetical protein HRT57_06250, partial [Crocinitomicaceae bacterium]|nr:hypothetical protein [Crocinitomicaceae bacterium]